MRNIIDNLPCYFVFSLVSPHPSTQAPGRSLSPGAWVEGEETTDITYRAVSQSGCGSLARSLHFCREENIFIILLNRVKGNTGGPGSGGSYVITQDYKEMYGRF